MIFEQIQSDIKEAMKAKNALKLSTLRSILAAMKNELVSGVKKESLTDEESLKILKKLGKQRKDSKEQFLAGGREDLAQKEAEELAIIETYLPTELTDEALKELITQSIQEFGSQNKSDMGKLMGLVIKKAGGLADGSRIKALLESYLQ